MSWRITGVAVNGGRMLMMVSRVLPSLVSLSLPVLTLAQFKPPDAGSLGLPGEQLESLLARVIQTSLLLVGVLALGFIVWGGFIYITSGGDETKVKAGKSMITYALLGIFFIGIAWAMVEFTIRVFQPGGGGGPAPGRGFS